MSSVVESRLRFLFQFLLRWLSFYISDRNTKFYRSLQDLITHITVRINCIITEWFVSLHHKRSLSETYVNICSVRHSQFHQVQCYMQVINIQPYRTNLPTHGIHYLICSSSRYIIKPQVLNWNIGLEMIVLEILHSLQWPRMDTNQIVFGHYSRLGYWVKCCWMLSSTGKYMKNLYV
jgi:hypothetical protein